MNYLKLQNELLKLSEKRDISGKYHNYRYGLTEDSVAVIVDAHEIVFIPKKYFYLDIEKVFNGMPFKLDSFLTFYDKEIASDTGITKRLTNGISVRVFSLENDEIFIDEKLLKYFDLKKSNYKGTKRNEPFYIFESEELVDIVLPINNPKEAI